MRRFTVRSLVALLSLVAAASAGAQVYRCGDGKTYTDKPCEGAAGVDLRVNLLDAGTRQIPPDPAPAPAIILPDPTPPRQTPSGGSVWQTRDSRASSHSSRTSGSR